MAEKRSFGVKSIKLGDIEADGGFSLNPTVLGDGRTLENTASFVKEEDEEKNFYAEEVDDPIDQILKSGAKTLKFAISDLTAATLVRVLGGADTAGVWEAPDTAPDIEQSIEITTQRDVVIKICRAKIKGSIDWPLSKEELGKVNITATVMAPTKAGEKAITIDPTAIT